MERLFLVVVCAQNGGFMQNIPRPEYPRPQMRRDCWQNLNGRWEFEIDNSLSGKERALQNAASLEEVFLEMTKGA